MIVSASGNGGKGICSRWWSPVNPVGPWWHVVLVCLAWLGIDSPFPDIGALKEESLVHSQDSLPDIGEKVCPANRDVE